MKKIIFIITALFVAVTSFGQNCVKYGGVTYLITENVSTTNTSETLIEVVKNVVVFTDSANATSLSGIVQFPASFELSTTSEEVTTKTTYNVTGFKYWRYGSKVSLDMSKLTSMTSLAISTNNSIYDPSSSYYSSTYYNYYNNSIGINSVIDTLKLPKSLTTFTWRVNNPTVNGIANITAFAVDADNENFSAKDGLLLDKAGTNLICYPQLKGTTYTIPSGITTIDTYAFYNNDKLVNISFPSSVTTISDRAFELCDKLKKVTFSTGLSTIGSYAFNSCSLLDSLTFASGLTSIGAYAFNECIKLSYVDMSSATKLSAISSHAFYHCNSLETVKFSSGLTSIEEYAFYDCDKLKTVDLSSSSKLSSLGNYAFYNNDLLETVKFSSGLISIGDNAFYGCAKLKTVDLSVSTSLTTIGTYAFRDCNKLETLKLPSTLTAIGDYAFYNCDGLESLTLPSALTTIGAYAFYDCDELYECEMPSSLQSIGSYAFNSCGKLSKVGTISDLKYLRTIDSYAFRDCNLTFADNTLTLPDSIETIGEYAFNNSFVNTSSTTVVFPSSLGTDGHKTKVGNNAFNCNVIRSMMTDPVNLGTSTYGSFLPFSSSVSKIYIPQGTSDTYKIKNGWKNYSSKMVESVSATPDLTISKPTIDTILVQNANGNKIVKIKMYVAYGDSIAKNDSILYKTFTKGAVDVDVAEWDVYTKGDSIGVSNTVTLKAVTKKNGKYSNISEFYCDHNALSCPSPTINIAEGDDKMTMSTSLSGGKIYYTTDNSEPTTSSSEYVPGTPLTVKGNYTYKAITAKSGMFNSTSVSQVVNWFKCTQIKTTDIKYYAKAPKSDSVLVEISGTTGEKIMYKHANSTYYLGSAAEMVYSGSAVGVPKGNVIRVWAVKDNYNNSDNTDVTLNSASITCSVPTYSANSETKSVTLTSDYNIYYTLDGTNPTLESSKATSGTPINLSENCTIKYFAHRDSMFSSDISSQTISNWFTCPNVSFKQSIVNGTASMELSLSDSTYAKGMTIYYMVDNYYSGADYWKQYGTQYTGPFSVRNGSTVYAVAMKDNFGMSGRTSSYVNYTTNGWTKCANPKISLDDKTKLVTITAADTLDIYYIITTDANEIPSTLSNKYLTPFTSATNGTVKAITAKSGYVNSDVVTADLSSWFRLENVIFEPQFELNGDDKTYKMKLSHNMDGAKITYYITTNSWGDDNATRKNYDGTPFEVSVGQYVYAMATKTGQVDSEWSSMYIQNSSFKVQKPTVERNSETKELIVTTTTANATMYYYTVDDNDGSLTNATKMTGDTLKLTQNDNYRFYAIKDKMETSDTLSVSVTDWFKLGQVTITPFVEDNRLKVRLTHSDPGATIYYGVNDYKNTVTSNLPYSSPIAVSNGDRIYASATKDHFQAANWNYSNNLYYSSYTCEQPTVSISVDTLVTIAHAEGTTVYYTLDGNDPTTSSSVYSEPFKLTKNAVIKAFAVMDNKINSEIYTLEYGRFYVQDLNINVQGTVMKVTTETPDVTIRYRYQAEATNDDNTYPYVYKDSIDLKYNNYIYLTAEKDGYNSTTGSYYVSGVRCTVEQESFDGHIMKLKAPENSTIWYTTDGSTPRDNTYYSYNNIYKYDGSITIDSAITAVKAIATHDYMLTSNVETINITAYAGAKGAKTTEAGQLATAMGWSTPSTIKEFAIDGFVNSADLEYIKENMTSLQTLDLSKAKLEDKIPDKAFAGMPLIAYMSPDNVTEVGDSIFTGCKELASVEWNSSTKLRDNSFDADINPNLLLFLKYETSAPANYTGNKIVNGQASLITLVDDEHSNFKCTQEFKAKVISYTHNFKMTSGNGGGWEAITLPFDVSRVFHESKGDMMPFASWEQNKPENYKPYWLCEFTVDGFVDAAQIKANRPYIVCMPNNEKYASRFRLGGKVTFYSEEVVVPVTNPISATRGNVTFTPNFQSKITNGDVLALNLEEYEEHVPGSIFVNDARIIRPFEAYATSIGLTRGFISVAETRGMNGGNDFTGIEERTIEDGNLVKVYNLSGVLVKECVKEDALKGLAKGVYIVNGKRMMVK